MHHYLTRLLLGMTGAWVTPCALAQAESDTTKTVDEIVVTGTNRATPARLLPYTVTTIDRQQIEATGRTQLLAALQGVPSLFVSERNIFGFGVSTGGSGGIKVRGVGGSPTSQVLMMVDGQPQFAGLYSHPVADFYEAEYVDHVEVMRGPGSVLYGSNAMGGVINVITKRERRDGVRTTLTSQYGSYNTWQTALTNTVRRGRFSSLVSLGYDRTDGLTDGFDFKQRSLYAKVGYDISGHWAAAADYSLMNFTGNDPVYPRLSDPASTTVYHQDITRGEGSLTLSNTYGGADGALRIYYSYGNHYIDDPRHFHSKDDRFGLLLYENFRPWRGAQATLGFDLANYTGQIPMSGGTAHTPGSRTTLGHKAIMEYSPYATLSQDFFGGRLNVNGGLRMANSDRFGTHYLPQVGLALHPGAGWTVKASMAKGYRNPSFRELYLYRTANRDLEPERMVNYEATVGHHASRYIGIDLTAYFSRGSNIIQTVNSLNVNTGSFRNKGIELTATSRPTDALALRASYSYLHTSLDALAAPKQQYYLGVNWQPIERLKVDADLRGVGSLYVADDVERQSYALIGLKLTYTPKACLDLFARMDNVANQSYEINRGYEMPGLTVNGGFKLRF